MSARVRAVTSQVAERGCVSASQDEAWRPIGQPGCTRAFAHTHRERRPVEREVRTRRRWSGSRTAGGSMFVMDACMAVTSTVATACLSFVQHGCAHPQHESCHVPWY